MALVRRNGKAYDSGDVKVNIDGDIFEDLVTEITYETKQEHQTNHGLSNNASSWSKGKISHTGSMTMYVEGVRHIERKCGNNLLAKKMFPINVTLIGEDGDIINDTLTAKFQSQGREVTGDMGLTQKFELFVFKIKYGNN